MLNIMMAFLLTYGGVKVTNKPIPGVPIVGQAETYPMKSNSKISTVKKAKPLSAFLAEHRASIKNGKLQILGSGAKGTDTLSYWDQSTSDYFYTDNPDSWDDSLHNVRFTPVNSGTLQGAAFWFYHLVGSGNIRIHVWSSDGTYPNTELGHLDIASSSIATDGSGTYIDLSSLGISIGSADFHIGFSCISPAETLGIILDTSGLASDRCIDMYGSSGWEHTSSWISGVDFLINAYVSTGGGGASYNLKPYQPTGWYAPLVISNVKDDTTAAPPGNYTSGDSAWVHWAVINEGPDSIPSTDTIYYYLYREGTAIAGWYTLGLRANYYVPVKNYGILETTDGSYQYTITADPNNTISETNESDNSYNATYTWGSGGGPSTPGNADYIIITQDSLASAFQPLVEWKNRKGIRTKVITLSYIYANYTGSDNADKIRNFIKDAHANWGTDYILLGGQCDYENSQEIVPRRNVYCMSSNAGYYTDEDTIISDLYFADTNGTWDGNGNGTYGETGDGVDMYPDVYVGRAPVLNVSEVNNFVNKVLTYEKSPNTTYNATSYYPQGNLWDTNHGTYMNDTMAQFEPGYWSDTYNREDIEGISETTVKNALNSGYGLCHIVGHGNEYGVYYNYGNNTMLSNSDADGLSNGLSKLTIFTSIACFSGAMDEVSGGDCFAEHLMNNTGGGAVADLFNSRYGWGTSSPEGALGASGEQSKYFFRAIHQSGLYILGQAWAQMENDMVSDASSSTYYRWCLYERNLLGDPSMFIWMNQPLSMTAVANPDTIQMNTNTTINITVTDPTKAAVQGATVALTQEINSDSFDVYQTNTTNSSGAASFTVNTPDSTPIILTVTSPTHLYYQDTIIVTALSVNEEKNRQNEFTNGLAIVRMGPNPVSRVFNVAFGARKGEEIGVSMYNVAGRKVYSSRMLGTGSLQNLSIDMHKNGISRGIYFIIMQTNKKRFVKKINYTR